MQLPRAPSSKVLPKCGWQSWETHASFPSIPHSLCSQFVFFFSDQILKFLLSQPPTQQLGDLRAPVSCIPRQGPSCLALCSQACLLNAQVGGQCLGEPSLACPPQSLTSPSVLGAEASVSHCQQPPPPGAPCGYNGASGPLGTTVLLPTTGVAARLFFPLTVELDLLKTPWVPQPCPYLILLLLRQPLLDKRRGPLHRLGACHGACVCKPPL